MKKSNTLEYVFICFLIVITTGISIAQTVLYTLKTPSAAYYPYVHNFVEDYYYYLHIMRQGYEGWWQATSWLTSEVFSARVVNLLFIVLGHVARITSLTLPATYTLARVFAGSVLLFLSYIFLRILYPSSALKRIVAMLFVSFSTYWWGWGTQGPQVARFVVEWTEFDPMFRWSYIPHHLWSKVGMLIAFICAYQFVEKEQNTLKFLMIAILATLFAGFASPVTYATLVPVMVLWLGMEVVFQKGWRACVARAARITGVIVCTALIVAIYHRIVQHDVFPWTSYLEWEKVQYAISIRSYVESLGPAFVFFLLSIFSLYKTSHGRLLMAWVFSGFLMVFVFARFIPLSNIRFLEGYQFIPIAIGAIEGIWLAGRSIGREPRYVKAFCVSVCVVSIAYFAVGMFASLKLHAAYVAMNTSNIQVYIPRDLVGIFAYLNGKQGQSVVLAPYEISTMIPALTGKRVVAGHTMMTYNNRDKKQRIDDFFSLSGSNRASSILSEFNISYIVSPSSYDVPGLVGAPVVTLVMETPSYTLYTVHL